MEVFSLNSARLVNELLAFLTKFSSSIVTSYFKGSLAGSCKGHSVAVIVSDFKDFSFVYKKRSGKLLIGFSYREWNSNRFPQHTC